MTNLMNMNDLLSEAAGLPEESFDNIADGNYDARIVDVDPHYVGKTSGKPCFHYTMVVQVPGEPVNGVDQFTERNEWVYMSLGTAEGMKRLQTFLSSKFDFALTTWEDIDSVVDIMLNREVKLEIKTNKTKRGEWRNVNIKDVM